jgi:phage baseplate assembly protein W
MSYDLKLGQECQHLTIEERVSLSDDRRSLFIRQPISSANQIQITANDIPIPREGRYSAAELVSSMSGPYSIDTCSSTISVSNRTEGIQNFALPVGVRVTADKLVEVLTKGFREQGVSIEVSSRRGVLVFKDTSELGESSRIAVSGDASKSLGFSFQTRARGRKVYPGWSLAERTEVTNLVNISDFAVVSTRYPKFDQPLKGNPVLKVSYVTYLKRCLRCSATGIENDYRIDASGEPIRVINEDLLNQSVLKIVITRKGSNPFHPSYGSSISTKIGLKALGATQTSINEDVSRAVAYFQRLQEAQSKVQEITLRERLYNIISVTTDPSIDDPTVFRTGIVAQNASGQPVSITTVFAAPGAAALVGTNGLSLGLAPLGIPG